MISKQILNYKITRKIGSGGMATVYEAIHTKLDTKVAIKVLDPVLAANESIRQRFMQEAKIMASLNHDGITKVLDFDEEDNHLAIIMEYLDGQTLDEYVKQKGVLNEDEAKDVFIPVLNAFSYAHNKGIVHRDVKPSNIFITTEGKVKIMDFGIAKIVEDGAKALTQTGAQMGTPVYMSPEQVHDSKNIDHRTDIYSLGVTLWFMLAGKPPYDADNNSSFDIFKKIDSEPLPELTMSPFLSEKIQKATEKERNNRFDSCRGFATHLQNKTILNEETIVSTEPIFNETGETLKTKKHPKKINSLKISLFFGISSVIFLFSTLFLWIGSLLAIISGFVGLVFAIIALLNIRKDQQLLKSRIVKNTLYFSFFLNSIWILIIIISLIISNGNSEGYM